MENNPQNFLFNLDLFFDADLRTASLLTLHGTVAIVTLALGDPLLSNQCGEISLRH